MDRVQTRTDALLHPEISTYDPNGNLKTVTDRKNQLPTYTYDPLDRRSCGSGSWGGQCLSLGNYVTGTRARGRGERRRRGLMLPTLQTPEGRVLFSREPPPHERRYECAHRGRYGS
jgi:YD repeat-containing protein